MAKIKIGFIGGCINNQRGINRDELYYAVASKLLSQDQTAHEITLGSYLSFNYLHEQTKIFINKKHPGLIYLFIRPFPLMTLQKPIIKYDTAYKTVAYSLHPALFSRKLYWNEKFTKYQSTDDFQFVSKNVFGFRDLNLIAGITFGLHNWTLKYLTHQLMLVKGTCDIHNIKLKIISPPQNPESIIANLTCKWITKFLDKYCKLLHLDLININSFPLTHFEQDKIHFNIQGHKKLGEVIYKNIKSDLKSKPGINPK